MSNNQLTGEVFYPSEEVVKKAHVKDWNELNEHAKKDYSGFWAEQANELYWIKKWDKVIDDSHKPFY